MRLIKIGMVVIDNTIGAMKSNTEKIKDALIKLGEEKCTLGCFQEQVIAGYPAEDLSQWSSFIERQNEALNAIVMMAKEYCPDTILTVGTTVCIESHLYNAVAVIHNGIKGIVPKEKLPTYDVFYDSRTFTPGIPYKEEEISFNYPVWDKVFFGDLIFKCPFGTLAVEVCEDIWSAAGPMRRRAYSGAEVIINASASPSRIGIVNTRKELGSTRASDNQSTLVYINALGGNTNLVFDGGGFINQNGKMMMEAPRWREGVFCQVIDLDRTSRLRQKNTTWRSDYVEYMKNHEKVCTIQLKAPQLPKGLKYPVPDSKNFFLPSDEVRKSPREEFFEDCLETMLMGLKGYFEKTGAFKKIGIALSGGKDSVLTAMLAWIYAKRKFTGPDAKKQIKEFVHCISMPTKFNTTETKNFSKELCKSLGLGFQEQSIEKEFALECQKLQELTGEEPGRITKQNIQARIRGNRMNNWSNETGGMWLQTGNMTEKAVGYTTVGGDLMGAYSLIGNLPKTVIIELLKYLASRYDLKILYQVASSGSSAELEFDQNDEEDLMPFKIIDACIYLFVEERMDKAEVIKVLYDMWNDEELKSLSKSYKDGIIEEWVDKFCKLFFQSIFKWELAPSAVHLGSIELDRSRALQIPIVQKEEWLTACLAA